MRHIADRLDPQLFLCISMIVRTYCVLCLVAGSSLGCVRTSMPCAKISFARFELRLSAFKLTRPLIGFACHPLALTRTDLSPGTPGDVRSLRSCRACWLRIESLPTG